jgi:hypothetical protein
MNTIQIIILVILLFSCGSKETSIIKIIDLLATHESEITNLSEIASDVRYIPLQTNENSIIKGISEIRSDNERIYLRSLPLTGLLCFDKKGQYLFKLENVGRRPGEYTFLHDFSIDPENNLLLTK